VLVAAGKGGVGKSTVAANLAVALKKHGAATGLLDADIYGPSVPIIMGVKGEPSKIEVNGAFKIAPTIAHGVPVMSIGFFLDSLFKMRDPTTVIVALTADHGVTPLPGTKSSDKNEKGVMVDLGPTFQNAFQRLQARGLDTLGLAFEEGVIHVNRDLFKKAKLNADSAVTALQKELGAIPGVMRVDRVRQLASKDTTRDAIARRWLHMLTPGEDHAELVVTLTPYSYPSGVGYATHGTPHDLDAHVPIIFYGPQFKPGTYKEFARVVDMAPTLAAVVGAKPTEKLDGRVLANGSFNWTRSATRDNDENLVVSDDANLMRVFGLQFEKLWQKFA
jgi:arylsulfatase A-like enzyme